MSQHHTVDGQPENGFSHPRGNNCLDEVIRESQSGVIQKNDADARNVVAGRPWEKHSPTSVDRAENVETGIGGVPTPPERGEFLGNSRTHVVGPVLRKMKGGTGEKFWLGRLVGENVKDNGQTEGIGVVRNEGEKGNVGNWGGGWGRALGRKTQDRGVCAEGRERLTKGAVKNSNKNRGEQSDGSLANALDA